MKRRCYVKLMRGYRSRLYIVNVFTLYAQEGYLNLHDGILLLEQVSPYAPLSMRACLIIPAAWADLGLIEQGKGFGWLRRRSIQNPNAMKIVTFTW